MAPARIAARRVLAGVLALGALVPFFGLVDLGTIVGLSAPSEQWPVPLEASWGCFFTFVVGGAYAWLAIARAPRFPVVQLAVAAGALAGGSLAGGDAGPLPVALALAVSVLLLCLIDPHVV